MVIFLIHKRGEVGNCWGWADGCCRCWTSGDVSRRVCKKERSSLHNSYIQIILNSIRVVELLPSRYHDPSNHKVGGGIFVLIGAGGADLIANLLIGNGDAQLGSHMIAQ
jgi:hypothetical protein